MPVLSARRRAATLAALTTALLLAATGCGPAEDPPAPASPDTQDTTADATRPAEETPTEETDDGERPTVTASPSAGEVPGSAEARSLVFVHSVEPGRLIEADGEQRLPAGDLAEIAEDMGGVSEGPGPDADPPSCEKDLRYVASADVRCAVTSTFDGSTRELTLVAHPIAAPGGAHGILFVLDDPLTEDARWATFNGANEVTAIGMGGAYGLDPIPAEQLVTDMQTVIDFDVTLDDVDTSQWTYTVRACPSALDFAQLTPVRCTATHDVTGEVHVAWALPGTFYGQEPGLIVSIELVPAGE